MTLQRLFSLSIFSLSIVLALGGVAPARAQWRGPPPGLPDMRAAGAGLPQVADRPEIPHVPKIPHPPGIAHRPDVPSLPPPASRVDDLLRGPLAVTRRTQINALIHAEPGRVTVDPRGEPVLRSEFLALGLSSTQLAAALTQGFSASRQSPADAALGLQLVVLHDTRGRGEAQALRVLQQMAPDVTFAYQHIYLPAGAGGKAAGNTLSTAANAGSIPRRVGLIDGGVDPAAPALAHAHIESFGCKTASVSRHGTAVAARLVAGDPDTLYAANLWCGGDAVGGATSQLVRALAWMARKRVPVINISLVGPDNPVLARAVQAMIARGHVLVSAVGNDGPAAPPLFPAAYPGVIGVSAVDSRDRVLPESGSGIQVAFCASGVVGSGRNAMRGTSFASPIVARRAAQLLDATQKGAALKVEQRLASETRDLGPPGRDPRYGYGLLLP